MESKVVLVLIDGMRPDGVEQCGHPFLSDLRRESSWCFQAKTVMPSVTLPCHTSLFFSVPPERHGITTNTWRPMVRPIESIGDAVKKAGKKAAMFYNWEELRDLNRPGSLHFSYYMAQNLPHHEPVMKDEQNMTQLAIDYIKQEQPDFLFLYLGYTDEAGHHHGWMGKEYLEALANASACVEKLKNSLPEGYQLIITADHGGHGRDHGLDCPEDMTIPIQFWGSRFEAGKQLDQVSILDIAPTITDLLELPRPKDWEGQSVFQK
ncbi:MAG: alkaline phosphatase family protein [Massiliimalia sp.]|jgi:predicted AlkP superfamily pyrophosphatase or phosphodiesterase